MASVIYRVTLKALVRVPEREIEAGTGRNKKSVIVPESVQETILQQIETSDRFQAIELKQEFSKFAFQSQVDAAVIVESATVSDFVYCSLDPLPHDGNPVESAAAPADNGTPPDLRD